jgi:hypothetical protein
MGDLSAQRFQCFWLQRLNWARPFGSTDSVTAYRTVRRTYDHRDEHCSKVLTQTVQPLIAIDLPVHARRPL